MATNVAGWIMTAIGKGVIVGVSVYLAILLADANAMTGGQEIQQPFIPAFVVLLIAWMVAAFYISLFDFACLTILQCFMISKDCQEPGGKIWAPKSLHEFLEKEGEPVDKSDKADTKGNQVAVAEPNQME